MTREPKIKIRFSVDKRGKRDYKGAHYWGLAHRWLPISIDAAELKLATGEAEPADPIRRKSCEEA